MGQILEKSEITISEHQVGVSAISENLLPEQADCGTGFQNKARTLAQPLVLEKKPNGTGHQNDSQRTQKNCNSADTYFLCLWRLGFGLFAGGGIQCDHLTQCGD